MKTPLDRATSKTPTGHEPLTPIQQAIVDVLAPIILAKILAADVADQSEPPNTKPARRRAS